MVTYATSGYRPTSLTFNNSWVGAKPYDAADIPVPNYMVSPGVDRTVLEQQFAYEWYDVSGRYSSGHNPPFTKGSAGRLLPQFSEDGVPRRILRGFIRRSDYDVADTKTSARLYFMYNPETITRDYVNYLDQGALDPFNTVFQAGNLVAPPSFMDFDFSLLFDRQEEASQDGTHPGVFVDYEYFDLVVRNVLPSYDPGGSSLGGSELPDNGVMMVNPRDITVVFSPNITVQGRPKNARVSFTKFTHRMIPIRMQIDLTIRVTYFGPMKDMVEYTEDQATTTDSVPWNVAKSDITITNAQILENKDLFLADMAKKVTESGMLTVEELEAKFDEQMATGALPSNTPELLASNASSTDLNASIAEWGLHQIQTYSTHYSGDNHNRAGLWNQADCSSWVWGVFASHQSKPNAKMSGAWTTTFEKGTTGGGQIPATNGMLDAMTTSPKQTIFQSRDGSQSTRNKAIYPNLPSVMKGDLLFRKSGVRNKDDRGHVAIVYSNDGKYLIDIVHCGGPKWENIASRSTLNYSYIANNYTECYRPMLGNPDVPGNRPSIGQNRPD